MPKDASSGNCKICGAQLAKSAMVAHVKKCLTPKSDSRVKKVPDDIVVVRAQWTESLIYWLLIGVRPDAQLSHLDKLLRETWLECCGHLSAFYLPGSQEIPKRTPVGKVFEVTKNLHYEYDFGDTTALTLSDSGSTPALLGRRVQILARNQAPVWPCNVCGNPARLVCVECRWEGKGFCCDAHAEDHECGEDMLLPVVNSPRMGVCGYSGEI